MRSLRCNSDGAIMCSEPIQVGCGPGSQEPTETITPEKVVRLKLFSFKELETATNGFSREAFMGQSSHGALYKGTLKNGKLVMVKRQEALEDEMAFDNELEIMSTFHSERFVNLVGFSKDSLKHQKKLLVVDFMPNGTLHDILHRCAEPLTWAMRVHLALQIAKSINALHSANPPVIHRDITSANILIDGRWNAKLGGFGLALRGHFEDVLKRPPPPAGTIGYFDPSYESPTRLSTKSDVFSFGVLLLELMSGRQAIDATYKPPQIVDWALPLVNKAKALAVLDPKLPVLPKNTKPLKNLLAIASRSVRRLAQERPSMSFITAALEDICSRIPLPQWIGLARMMKANHTVPRLESPANRDLIGRKMLGWDDYGYSAKSQSCSYDTNSPGIGDFYQDSGWGPDLDLAEFLQARLEYSRASTGDENQSLPKGKSSNANSRDVSFRKLRRDSRESSKDHVTGELQQQPPSRPRHGSRGRSRERSRASSRERSRHHHSVKSSDNVLTRVDVGEAGWHPLVQMEKVVEDSGTRPTDRSETTSAARAAQNIVPVKLSRPARHRRNRSDGSLSLSDDKFLPVSNHGAEDHTKNLKNRPNSSKSYWLNADIRMLS